MQTTILVMFIGTSRTVIAMCAAGILVSLIALWAARTNIARAPGLEKIVPQLFVLCRSVLRSSARFTSLAWNSRAPYVP